MRFTIAAFAASALWWAMGAVMAPDLVLNRSPASLVVALITGVVTAHLARPIYRRAAAHLLWLTPASVYFGAAVFGYLLPLVTERTAVLEHCLETMRALCVGVSVSVAALAVFPAALATHWLLRRVERREEPPHLDQRAA